MGEAMKSHESEEMYLETILLLQERGSSVHAIDIAGELGYAKSSVSRAMGLLLKKGYIEIGENDEIRLTKVGYAKASDIYERHLVITALLVHMGADEQMAEENACRIEHVITPDLFEIMKQFIKGN